MRTNYLGPCDSCRGEGARGTGRRDIAQLGPGTQEGFLEETHQPSLGQQLEAVQAGRGVRGVTGSRSSK